MFLVRRLFFPLLLILSLAIPSISVAGTWDQCTFNGLKLTAADKEVLELIKTKEEAAGVGKHVLAWAPLIMFASSPKPENFAIVISTTDWEGHANAISNLEKIKSCAIKRDIQLHMISLAGERLKFFRCLSNFYAKGC